MSGPVVVTTEGPVEGVAFERHLRFLGIPYAEAPVGALRFRGPQPPASHVEVLQASRFGPSAPQMASVMEDVLSEGAQLTVSEPDSLVLNVFTPSADAARRPVMVWVHGGGFAWGTSSSPWYDGTRFAEDHDVVVVSCNYRLGSLGYSFFGPLADPSFSGSGSVGVQDVIAVLAWVARNIESFGGDPGNVTAFGESAGAMSIATLLAMPAAQGLVHKAILQSGAASSVLDADTAQRRLAALATALGVEPTPEHLQAVAVEAILHAHALVERQYADEGPLYRPVVDGAVLPRVPLEAVAAGAASEVPMLIGTNLDEWRLFSFMDPSFVGITEERLEAAVAARFRGDAAVAINTYRKRLDEDTPSRVLESVSTDAFFRAPALRLAEAQHRSGGAVWMYLFTWPSEGFGGGLGACHGLELPFVFNTIDKPSSRLVLGETAPSRLADDINATWAAFARSGDPATGPLATWPSYTPTTRATMILDATTRVEDDPLAEERELWQGLDER